MAGYLGMSSGLIKIQGGHDGELIFSPKNISLGEFTHSPSLAYHIFSTRLGLDFDRA